MKNNNEEVATSANVFTPLHSNNSQQNEPYKYYSTVWLNLASNLQKELIATPFLT